MPWFEKLLEMAAACSRSHRNLFPSDPLRRRAVPVSESAENLHRSNLFARVNTFGVVRCVKTDSLRNEITSQGTDPSAASVTKERSEAGRRPQPRKITEEVKKPKK
jgi:hypothetical protein